MEEFPKREIWRVDCREAFILPAFEIIIGDLPTRHNLVGEEIRERGSVRLKRILIYPGNFTESENWLSFTVPLGNFTGISSSPPRARTSLARMLIYIPSSPSSREISI
jgi:hypothetical protein